MVQLLATFIDISRLPSARLVPDSMNARDDQKKKIGNLIKKAYNNFDTVGYIEVRNVASKCLRSFELLLLLLVFER